MVGLSKIKVSLNSVYFEFDDLYVLVEVNIYVWGNISLFYDWKMCVESSCNNCKLFWMPVKNLYMYSLIWFYKSLYYTYVYLLTYQYISICSGKISISFWKILIVWFIWCLFRSIIKILWKLLVSSELIVLCACL